MIAFLAAIDRHSLADLVRPQTLLQKLKRGKPKGPPGTPYTLDETLNPIQIKSAALRARGGHTAHGNASPRTSEQFARQIHANGLSRQPKVDTHRQNVCFGPLMSGQREILDLGQ